MARIDVGGLELHYHWSGAATGRVLVFVNGLLTDSSSWTPHLEKFGDRRCLLWDCRGQGQSDKPIAEAYTVDEHGRDLAALLDGLGVDEPVDIIGLSNGGAAALCLAAAQPERVASLIVCGAYARADKALEFKLRSWIEAMRIGGAALRFDVATPWVWGPRFLAEHWQALLEYRAKGASLDAAVVERLINGAMRHHLDDDELARVRARTLVTVGSEDVLTPVRMAQDIVERLANAHLEILPGMGHAAALEQVGRFCELVRRFLACPTADP